MALARWQRTITSNGGVVLPGASVEVRRESDNGLQSLFSDRAGAAGIANPFAADSEGFAAFHAVGGVYKVTATLGSLTRTWRYVGVGTAQEFDADQLPLTYANFPDVPDGQVVGRPLGAGAGDPQSLTPAQLQAAFNSVGGPLFGPTRTLSLSTTPTNLAAADSGKFVFNSNATRVVNLPTGAPGLCYGFAHFGTGSLTVNTAGGGSGFGFPDASFVTSGIVLDGTNGQFGIVVCDGANWAVYAASIGQVSATTSVEGVVEFATAAEYRANTPLRGLDNNDVWAAADLVALTDAATVAVDFSTGINFTVTLGGNRALGTPSSTKNGQTGVIYVVQDGTGSRTLTYNANWKFAGGIVPSLTTTAGAVDALYYQVRSSTFVLLTLAKAWA